MKPGDYVRFYPVRLPANRNATPIRVTEVLPNKMIRLEGWAGQFAAHLFVVVKKAKEAA